MGNIVLQVNLSAMFVLENVKNTFSVLVFPGLKLETTSLSKL
jgi:hypothetical protein